MDERSQSMFKPKIRGSVQEVIFPDFPDDDNTTTTVTKSRRVSFGSNFVKEFIVGSAVSAQCVSEYEQAFSSSDSSNANSSHSAVESGILSQNTYVLEENYKMSAPIDAEEKSNKRPKISSTICFSAESPTDDMEFTEGCISLAKHILDKKNREMTVIIQAKPKDAKDEVKGNKDEETNFFEGSNLNMSMTKCFKSKYDKKVEKKYQSEKTRIFNKFDDEMSITRCNEVLTVQQSNMHSDESEESWEKDDCKENQMPLDLIMRHLDKDDSDIDKFLFNPEKTLTDFLKGNVFETFNESEKLNLNESMDISKDFQPNFFKNPAASGMKNYEREELGASSMDEASNNEEIISRRENPADVSVQREEDSFLEALASGGDVEENKGVLDEMEITFAKEVNSDATLATPVEITEDLGVFLEKKGRGVEISREEEMEESIAENLREEPENEEETEGIRSERLAEELAEEQLVESLTENHLVVQDGGDENVAVDMCICREKVEESNEFEKVQETITGENSVDEKIEGNQLAGEKIGKNDGLRNQTIDKEKETSPQKDYLMVEESAVNLKNQEKQTAVENNSEEQIDSFEKINGSVDEILLNGDRAIENANVEAQMEAGALEVDDKMKEINLTKIITEHDTEKISHEEKMDGSVDEIPLNGDRTVGNANVEAQIEAGALEVGGKVKEINLTKIITEHDTEKISHDEKMDDDVYNANVDMSLTKVRTGDLAMNSNVQPEMEATMDGRDEPMDQTRAEEREEISLCRSEISASDFLEPSENLVENPDHSDANPPARPAEKENDTQPSLSLMDTKIIENLKEQSKEPGCIWKLKDLHYPTSQSLGFLEFSFELLESLMTLKFSMKSSEEDTIDACCTVSTSEMYINEVDELKLPEYKLVIDFGFEKLEKYFKEERKSVKTIRHVPYFLDEMNIFTLKINTCLQQVLSILTMYPGSRLLGSTLSFRLFSFPVFFSCTVSIDLTDLYRLSSSSLSFDVDLGSVDKNKIRDIFQECLKCDNPLREFVIKSTKYIIDLERETGYVSKRGHIRLLPSDCH